MPHPLVGAPCADCTCADCECHVCLRVTGCGAHVPVDFGVYAATDCTGTPILAGHYDGTTPACFCLPADGDYGLQLTPTGGGAAIYRPRCTLLSVTVDDCAGTKDVTLDVYPYLYDVSITILGCVNDLRIGSAPDYECYWSGCPLEGLTVTWDDGTNSVSGTTTSAGMVVFMGLTTPTVGATYAVTIAADPDCGWESSTGRGGTISAGDLCGIFKVYSPDIRGGYVCSQVCGHPLPERFTLTIRGRAVNLDYAGDPPPGEHDGYSVWIGCDAPSCDGATVATCAGYPLDNDRYRYDPATVTAPLKYALVLTNPASLFRCPDDTGCYQFDWSLQQLGWSSATHCDVDDGDQLVLDKLWLIKDDGTDAYSVDVPACATYTPPDHYLIYRAWLSVLASSGGTAAACDCPITLSGTMGGTGCIGGGWSLE